MGYQGLNSIGNLNQRAWVSSLTECIAYSGYSLLPTLYDISVHRSALTQHSIT